MKNFPWRLSLLGLILLIFNRCVEPYQPPQITQERGHLVVEGFLNPGDTSVIRLTRTQQLDQAGNPTVESGARLWVEGERGSIFSFTEKNNGEYTLANAALVVGEKYRLRIRTANANEYVSEFVPVKTTPAVESLFWEVSDDGVRVYLNARDPENNTRYYGWDFEETWEFTVPYPAGYEYTGGKPTVITDNLYRCWRTERSQNIYLGSSVRLSEDIIYKFPIVFLPVNSPEHRIKYSILVRQRALTKEAYEYMENLRRNTENIGTLFDPLPSQLTSNITCANNPEEKVFGFFSAHSVAEKRLFISRDQLPEWRTVTGYESCELDTVLFRNASERSYPRIFYSEVYTLGGPPAAIGYTQSAVPCMDCRTAGSNQRPDFWQ